MIGFAAAAAALTALTVALLVLPLMRARSRVRGVTQAEASIAVLRDQLAELERELAAGTISAEAGALTRRELKSRLLEDAAPEDAPRDQPRLVPALLLAALVPLAAGALYAWRGELGAIAPAAAPTAEEPGAAQIEAMVEKLARRLRDAPEDTEGWAMLARAYRVLGRHDEAVRAFERAEPRIATDARQLTDWAESLALVQEGSLRGKPTTLVTRALAIDPDSAHALALAGAAAFERGEFKAAIAYWERLAKQFPSGSKEADTVARSIAAAREKLK